VYPDEVLDVSANEDVLNVIVPPQDNVRVGRPLGDYVDHQKYLWLVTPGRVLIALEYGLSGLDLQRQRLSHTNLSGGEDAHAGGELWFYDNHSVMVNGGSSRYEPRSVEELQALADSFVSARYRVCCAEWNSDLDRPERVFRGKEPWL